MKNKTWFIKHPIMMLFLEIRTCTCKLMTSWNGWHYFWEGSELRQCNIPFRYSRWCWRLPRQASSLTHVQPPAAVASKDYMDDFLYLNPSSTGSLELAAYCMSHTSCLKHLKVSRSHEERLYRDSHLRVFWYQDVSMKVYTCRYIWHQRVRFHLS